MRRLFSGAWIAAWTGLAALTAAGWLGCAAPTPSRSLYQWTDASGNVRYTSFPDRIPRGRRGTRKVVEAPARAQASTALPAATVTIPLPAAPATAPPAVEAPPTPANPLDARIAELEAQVKADEEALKTMISDPAQAEALRSSPRLHQIAEQLPQLQAELAVLRKQRAAAAHPQQQGQQPGGPEAQAPAPAGPGATTPEAAQPKAEDGQEPPAGDHGS